jgi:hypothetical protein
MAEIVGILVFHLQKYYRTTTLTAKGKGDVYNGNNGTCTSPICGAGEVKLAVCMRLQGLTPQTFESTILCCKLLTIQSWSLKLYIV